jgi:hypothetical protein
MIDDGVARVVAPQTPLIFRARKSSCRVTVKATVMAHVDHRKSL